VPRKPRQPRRESRQGWVPGEASNEGWCGFSRALCKVSSGRSHEIVAWTPVRLHARGQGDARPARAAEAAFASCSSRRVGVRARMSARGRTDRPAGAGHDPRGNTIRMISLCDPRKRRSRARGRPHMTAPQTRTCDDDTGQPARCCSALSSLRTRWPSGAPERGATAA
jgi:hypothetical protein